MAAKVLSGTELSRLKKEKLKQEVDILKSMGITPGLAVVIVGHNPASRLYVDFKKKDCAEVGIKSFEFALDKDISEKELIGLINRLNSDVKVSGILVQLPLPSHIDEGRIIDAIDPKKDADCFHPQNVGRLMAGKPVFSPCTPAGIVELLNYNNIGFEGKECVIINRSNIVGKPLAIMMLARNCTVTICHSRTNDLKGVCKRADILIAAVGRAKFIKAEDIKDGAVVVDVGVNRLENGKLAGDVDFENVSKAASAITKVTGGVGPMTRAMLLQNTVTAAKNLKDDIQAKMP